MTTWEVEVNDRGYKYLNWRHGAHNRYFVRLWLTKDYIQETLTFPQ